VRPFFKPGWDPELQRARDFLGPFTFFRTALLRGVAPAAGPAWLYDLANQAAAAAQPDRIRHIPAVLCHRVVPPDLASQRAAAAAQLQRDGVAARVEPAAPDWNRVAYALPEPAPLVSIIVPMRDRADLLRVCAESVLEGTDYPNLELLIVDNGSVEPDALALLDTLAADERVQVLRQPGAFNWSALNNAAAARAAGSVLVLLNNDIAVLQPDWLTVLVAHTLQPGVGAVGAKLLYPDGRVQHAGLTTDESGVPRHLFRHLDGGAPGAFGLAGLTRSVWGVTGACMAIPRAVFVGLGGLNEAFPVTYNDVEFCLRLAAHGYRILWTPWSRLEHREAATRPSDLTQSRREQLQLELDRLRRDWGRRMLHDPFFNANLQLADEQPHYRKDPRPVPNS
jgi:GT2 family glycosyltransferase